MNKDKKIHVDYMKFISVAKTERLCVTEMEKLLIENGFKQYNNATTFVPGDKVYFKNKNKNIAAFIFGKLSTDNGLNILGAHIDAPRIDIKQQPLYENSDIAYFDTQYYGGIKKYQWTTIPLALHGIVCRSNGTTMNIDIGEDPSEPAFYITDLLPHLDKKLGEKKASEFINGEKLDIIVATTKAEADNDKEEKEDKDNKKVKQWVLDYLKKYYYIEEEDLVSAELELVPAGIARFSGLDKSLIAGYGQDDRSCAYTSLRALLDITEDGHIPELTAGCVFVDKEEVGSICSTGAKSRWFQDILRCIIKPKDEIHFAAALAKINMLSSDVTAAFDPLYADAYDKKSSAKLGKGIVFSKYNGGRGKSDGADANPEFIGYVRKIMQDAGITYQFDSMGKVDIGGGGTIASIVSDLNINVLDAGIPVLNMHSPNEITHKDDIDEAYYGYKAFLF